ncbi:MAG TPA: XRE family transcriptional regulator [Chitinophaga sp.]|uniref:helix-turn-helix domain-containing protein n=1 Tax=Chitinophaga sp. TaxID=1869181 RepID=UPI002DB831B0|nr:XRE family transcriptional regulator [Chitinophaga sp.]HEU4554127.1 XRE family transcriptional regulator [Chitinophaga sp.]
MEHFPERLKSARKMKGWSLQDLADGMANAVTKQALNKYEAGVMKPSGEVLLQLAKALEVPPAYFMRPSSIQLPAVEFRKKAALSAKHIESIKEKVKHFLERYLEVEALLNIKSAFHNPVRNIPVSQPADVDNVVEKIIAKWDLGYDAIPNVIEMLEDKGIRVMEIDAPDEFDGLSACVGNIPVVVLNNAYTVERKRFTALHELGHLLLNIQQGADKEKICHAFAGAMLLPGNCLETLIGKKRTNIAPGELVSIKEQFGISVQAIMMRALHKGIINKSAAVRFWQSMAKNKKESGLGAYPGKEKSYRFDHLVFRLAAEDIVSMSKAASLAGIKLAAFREKLDAFEE